jgi:hypothetical protein
METGSGSYEGEPVTHSNFWGGFDRDDSDDDILITPEYDDTESDVGDDLSEVFGRRVRDFDTYLTVGGSVFEHDVRPAPGDAPAPHDPLAVVVRELETDTADLPRVHKAALELSELMSRRTDAAALTAEDPTLVPMREAARTLVAELEAAGLSDDLLAKLQPLIDTLSEYLGCALKYPPTRFENTPHARSDHGPQRLLVAARGGGNVSVGGWLAPARLFHVTKSDNVIIGNDCELRQTEHHHFERIGVATQDMFNDDAVRRTLRDLVQDPESAGHDRAFRNALVDLLAGQRQAPAEAVETALASSFASAVTRSGVVQVGDGSELESDMPIYVREVELPLAELLVRDSALRHAFVSVIRDPDPEGNGTQMFLRTMLSAAPDTDHDMLLADAASDGVYDAAVFGLFGFTNISNAGAVLAGAGNTLVRDAELDTGTFFDQDVVHMLSTLRTDLAPPLQEAPDEEIGDRPGPLPNIDVVQPYRPRPSGPKAQVPRGHSILPPSSSKGHHDVEDRDIEGPLR